MIGGAFDFGLNQVCAVARNRGNAKRLFLRECRANHRAKLRGVGVEKLAPVRINLIAAGFVDTPLSASLLGG